MANGINMSKHHVPAESIAKSHRSLEVDWVACMKGAQVGSRIGFVADVGIPIRRTISGNNGEAATVDGNGCAEAGTLQHQVCLDAQARAIALGYFAQFFYDPGEHSSSHYLYRPWLGGGIAALKR